MPHNSAYNYLKPVSISWVFSFLYLVEDDIGVRLTNSSSRGQGTVEYRCLDDWLNICFDTWYPASANTLCNQLGYGGVVEDVQVAMPTTSLANISFYCSTLTQNDHIFDCLMAEESCVSGNAVSVTCGLGKLKCPQNIICHYLLNKNAAESKQSCGIRITNRMA